MRRRLTFIQLPVRVSRGVATGGSRAPRWARTRLTSPSAPASASEELQGRPRRLNSHNNASGLDVKQSVDKSSLPSEASADFGERDAQEVTVMRSHRQRYMPPAGDLPFAYLHDSTNARAKTSTKGNTPAAEAKTSVELDDGERVAVRSGLVALRRTMGGDSQSDTIRDILSDPDKADLAMQVAQSRELDDAQKERGGPTRQQRQRLKELRRVESQRGAVCHPCRLQGGCHSPHNSPAAADSTHCAYLQHPSVCCVDHLRTGVCSLRAESLCPWHHGDLSTGSVKNMLAESLIVDEGTDETAKESVQRRLRAFAPQAAILLRLFVDVITAVVEEGPEECRVAFVSDPSKRLECVHRSLAFILSDPNSADRMPWLPMIVPLEEATAGALIKLDWNVAREAAAAAVVDTTNECSYSPSSGSSPVRTAAEELEALWQDAERDDETATTAPAPLAHEVDAETEIDHLWQSFFLLNRNTGDVHTLSLSSPLTTWALEEASIGLNAASVPEAQDLLAGAMKALLHERWRECRLFLQAADSNRQRNPWAPLLLLKDTMMSKALCLPTAVGDEMDFMGAAAEQSKKGGYSLPSYFLSHVALDGCSLDAKSTSHGELSRRFHAHWGGWHALLLQLGEGLLYHGSDMASFTQPALVGLAQHAGEDMRGLYEASLLDSVGWQPLTDEVLFATYQSAAHSASSYARHNMRVVAPSCVNSLINGLLMCVVRHAEHQCGLAPPSPIKRIFQAPPTNTQWSQWLARYGSRDHERVRGYVRTAMSLVSALQEVGGNVLQQREALMQDFESRREAFMSAHASGSNSNTNTHQRTRKYNNNIKSTSELAAELELKSVHPMDLLLPYASPVVCAPAAALLVRLLLEGGSPYRSMRLSVSVMHMSRMLRHAAKQPRAELVETHKFVHRLVRAKSSGKKQLQRIRVPILKVVDSARSDTADMSGELGDVSRKGNRSLKPVGLLYAMDEALVAEVVRTGLRMGTAGDKLADGALDDCVRGAVVDFSAARCLPVPSAEEVRQYLVSQSGSSSSRAGPWQHMLHMIGAGNSAEKHTSDGFPAHRVVATPEVLEILLTHTDRQHRQQRVMQQCHTSLISPSVVFAWQLAWTARSPQHAVQAMLTVWVPAVLQSTQPLASLGTWAEVRRQADAHRDLVEGWVQGPQHLRPTSHSRAPTNTAELKSYLSSEGDWGQTAEAQAQEADSKQRRHAKARRAHHEALLHKAWLRLGNASASQRAWTLWYVCAATLMGLAPESVESAEQSSLRASQTLLNTVVAAMHLLQHCHVAEAMDNTVKALLLSRIWGKSSTDLPLSTARAPLIVDFSSFLQLQVHLANSLNTTTPLLERLAEQQRPASESLPVTASAAWCLVRPLQEHPDAAQQWLSHCLFQPSPPLLVWIAAHIDSNDLQGLESFKQWLAILPDAIPGYIVQLLSGRIDGLIKKSRYTNTRQHVDAKHKKKAVTSHHK